MVTYLDRISSGFEPVVALLHRFESCSVSKFLPRSFGSFVDARAAAAAAAATVAAAATTTATEQQQQHNNNNNNNLTPSYRSKECYKVAEFTCTPFPY